MTAPGGPATTVPQVRPHRVIPVHVDTLPIEDGHTDPPVVGRLGSFVLGFRESSDHSPDATAGTYRVRAEPLDTHRPRQGMHWDNTPNELPPRWRVLLHGDGWSATWLAPRPVLGRVELRGTITGEWSYGVSRLTRGRVTRARMVTETHERSGPALGEWRRIHTAQRLRDIDTAPHRFDGGLVRGEYIPHLNGWSMVPPNPWVQETGVLVDLDLDDVPHYPLRPAFVPGGLAAHGADLWISDTRLPTLVRLRDHAVADVITWPGVVLGSEQSVPGRVLHADATGCWITGPDGIIRVDLDGTIRVLRDEPAAPTAATTAGTLAARLTLEPDHPRSPTALVLLHPDGSNIDVPTPGRRVHSLTADGNRFLATLAGEDDHVLARIDTDGHLTQGPPPHPRSQDGYLILGGAPLLRTPAALHRIQPDLTLDAGTPTPIRTRPGWVTAPHNAWAYAGRVLVSGGFPRAARDDNWWPLDGAPPLPAERRQAHHLLSELDPHTLQHRSTTIVPNGLTHLAVTDDGTVYITANRLYQCPREHGALAEPLDLTALLDHPDAPPPTPPRWG